MELNTNLISLKVKMLYQGQEKSGFIFSWFLQVKLWFGKIFFFFLQRINLPYKESNILFAQKNKAETNTMFLSQ